MENSGRRWVQEPGASHRNNSFQMADRLMRSAVSNHPLSPYSMRDLMDVLKATWIPFFDNGQSLKTVFMYDSELWDSGRHHISGTDIRIRSGAS